MGKLPVREIEWDRGRHTPRRWGAPLSAGVLPFAGFDSRPLRTNCWMVGTKVPFLTC